MQATAQKENDEQLMGRVMLGDSAALSLLVERHHSPLMGYLYRLLNSDRPLAEDLTQETFVRLLTSAGSDKRGYQTGRPFKPWLYAIATNLARDHFKSADMRYSSSPRYAMGGDELIGEVISETPGPEEEVVATETSIEIADAIARLAPEYRSALLLRFYGGMSLQEVAQALDIPLGTVKSRLSVGCRRLRDLLTAGETKSRLCKARESGE